MAVYAAVCTAGTAGQDDPLTPVTHATGKPGHLTMPRSISELFSLLQAVPLGEGRTRARGSQVSEETREGPTLAKYCVHVCALVGCNQENVRRNFRTRVITCVANSESIRVERASQEPRYPSAAILIAARACQGCADNCATRKGVIF